MAEAARQIRLSAVVLVRDIEETAKKRADQRARAIVVIATQRCAAERTSESVVSNVGPPGDETKGRIIGRKGRNIRAFEQITGVNVMMGDTSETVLLSYFDPVRRKATRLTFMDLVTDRCTHPVRTEEVHTHSIQMLDEHIRAIGNEVLLEARIADSRLELIPVVGSLIYRTSLGQNVFAHLIEYSYLAGTMAAELGLDVAQCKRVALLRDIGKTLTHGPKGPHTIISAGPLHRHGEHPDVAHTVEARHNETEPRTVKVIFTQAANVIFGPRPGVRHESLGAYVERIQHLESIAMAHEEVVRAYAMQAGREARIMAAPEAVDDAMSRVLTREIAAEVETNLTYPGQIHITTVYGSRVTELAR